MLPIAGSSFFAQRKGSSCILITFQVMLMGIFSVYVWWVSCTYEMDQPQSHYKYKITTSNDSLIRMSIHLHGHYFLCYFDHRHLNDAWHNKQHLLLWKPHLVIIASSVPIKSSWKVGTEAKNYLEEALHFINALWNPHQSANMFYSSLLHCLQ